MECSEAMKSINVINVIEVGHTLCRCRHTIRRESMVGHFDALSHPQALGVDNLLHHSSG